MKPPPRLFIPLIRFSQATQSPGAEPPQYTNMMSRLLINSATPAASLNPALHPTSSEKLSSTNSTGMDGTAGQGVYPLHRTKTLQLVRHAQGIHNVEGEKDRNNCLSEALFDAHLTHLGWQQVDNLQKHVQASGLNRTIELVICSPLLRTMQTAVGGFGGGGYTNGITAPPLVVANAGESNRPAISSLNCPPLLAFDLCQERLGLYPCDRRRSISEYRTLFPAIDFSLIENDANILWRPDVREENEQVASRGMKFLRWLWTRKEKEIAVVYHSGFLYQMFSAFGNDYHPIVKSEICTRFANCELRSMVIVDKGYVDSWKS